MLAGIFALIGTQEQRTSLNWSFELFFPYARAMALLLPANVPLEMSFAVLAVAFVTPYPIYGLLLGWAASRNRLKLGWFTVGVIHFAGVLLCLLGGKS